MTTITTKHKKVIAGLALAALTGVIVTGIVILPAQTASTKTRLTTSAPTTQPQPATTSAAGYKDGTYKATGQYFSPGGKETIQVSLTLANNSVTAADVTQGANDPTAVSYQTLFISGYKTKVVGKKVDSIKLTNVSGSSLTSQGFNNALKQIKQQAQA